MKAQELMTASPSVVTGEDPVIAAAQIMREVDVGMVPVVDAERDMHLVGVITDRDIATRCVAAGHAVSECTVRDHMTPAPVVTASPGDDVRKLTEAMERAQVRRIPVVDRTGKLVGVVAQADIAVELSDAEPEITAHLVEEVSQPGQQLRM